MAKVTVNGKEFITHRAITIIADGYEVDLGSLSGKCINITVEGNVESMSLLHAKAKVAGNVATLQAKHGDVVVEGDGGVNVLAAAEANVKINGNINGNVRAIALRCNTINGNVDCGYVKCETIEGEIHTVNGGRVDVNNIFDGIYDDDIESLEDE
ncbi:hypothetical protein IJL65_02790 [bacterium]|nr:hypothetical protein [bacterium]